ncbi:MAG: TRAP transporter small permease subunit [Acidobacteriota bacterium]
MDRWLQRCGIVVRAVDAFHDWVGRAMGWLVLLMVLLGAFNAVARYAGRSLGRDLSSNGYLEAQWYLFSAIFLLAAAYGLRRNAHVRVDVLYGRLSSRWRHWIDLVGSLLLLLPFCLFAIWSSWPSLLASWRILEQSPDPGGLPRYPLWALIPIAFAMLALQGFAEVIRNLAALRGIELKSNGPESNGPESNGPQSTEMKSGVATSDSFTAAASAASPSLAEGETGPPQHPGEAS